ncbi:cell division site-positioning protein MapZ family protein [Vagococcus intermedius]|uniref:Cell division site-positioning protein MapZ family protein n=1 Tax=Vagococcus intermedius TaxID=2991418 RepID=A0AAF0CU92_9ENTE|nr:cell division site-positioning protein MapZ family protein [Vagococcus intermedius]WEG72964.1 cell division site-positioning protein MapZ family protein [Vagococcus intermedius]WEG75050.1 cell division site-positioning protein MapZ family protein [Vagococcus intermedius]
MSRGVKCPNCGHIVTAEEKVCPNCDIFQPGAEEINAALVLKKDRKSQQKAKNDSKESNSKKEKVEVASTDTKATANTALIADEVASSSPSQQEETLPSSDQEVSTEAKEEATSADKKAAMVAGIGAAASAAGMKTTSSKKEDISQSELKTESKLPEKDSPEPPKKSKNVKKTLGVIALLALLMGGGYYGVTKYQENQVIEAQKSHDKMLTKLTSDVDNLFLDKRKLFLNDSFTPKQLASLKKEVKSLGKEDDTQKNLLTATLDEVEEVFDRQKEVNELFEEPVIKGDKVLEDVALSSEKPRLPKMIEQPKDPLDETINLAIGVANKQVETSGKVQKEIDALFDQEGNLKEEVTKKELSAVQKKLSTAINPTLKKQLAEKLAKVDNELQEKAAKKAAVEKEKAAKKANARKEKAEKEKVEKEKAAKEAVAKKAKVEKEKMAKEAAAKKAEAEKEKVAKEASDKQINAEKENATKEDESKDSEIASPQIEEQQLVEETAEQAELEQQILDEQQQKEALDEQYDAEETAKQTEIEAEVAKQAEEAANREQEAAKNIEGDWSWAPGIQEKVINECLSRGYMTEGGYELRQREIVNGEAYYDLYATNTDSPLLRKRNPKDVPIYLVTINAKTGWFKGDGGPNA